MCATAKVWKVHGPLIGTVTKDHFRFGEETLPVLRDGEFLAETTFLTVDPYMKAFAAELKGGEVMASAFGVMNQVAKIKKSKNTKFPVGTVIASSQGWRTHFISNGDDVTVLPDMGGLSASHALGALGMPGQTAYCSLVDGCQAKQGDVLVVNAAAGAVGYLIVQIAKTLGCTVIAYAGTDAKCEWLRELGADHVFNYKKTNLAETLQKAAPNGVDVFIDHVGGETFPTILNRMRPEGRVSILGAMSQYNKKPGELDKITFDALGITGKEVVIKGFNVGKRRHRGPEVAAQLIQWNKEGKVKFRETFLEGFEKMVDGFLSMFSGQDNYGKVIIKV